jgi:hypothetical protein
MKKHDFRRKEEQFVHWFAFRNMKDKLYGSKHDISSAAKKTPFRIHTNTAGKNEAQDLMYRHK